MVDKKGYPKSKHYCLERPNGRGGPSIAEITEETEKDRKRGLRFGGIKKSSIPRHFLRRLTPAGHRRAGVDTLGEKEEGK